LKFQVQHAESCCCALFVPSFSFFLLSHAASLLAVASVPCAGSPWYTPGTFSLYFFFADFFFFSPITNPQGCNMTPPPTVTTCQRQHVGSIATYTGLPSAGALFFSFFSFFLFSANFFFSCPIPTLPSLPMDA